MADAPKKDEGGLTLFEEVVMFLILLYFFIMLWGRVSDFYAYYHGGSFGSLWAGFVSYFYSHVVPIFRIFAFLASGLAVWGILHAYTKLSSIVKEENEIYGAKLASEDAPVPIYKNEKWERVLAHVNSSNASDWRLAIIEADIMLDELLKTLGMHGESLGERLKSVDKADMLTLDNAWEAHRIRNHIAHAGADYALSDREAKRAVALYESVFKEYKII